LSGETFQDECAVATGNSAAGVPKGVQDRGPSRKKRVQGDGGPTRPLHQVERALRARFRPWIQRPRWPELLDLIFSQPGFSSETILRWGLGFHGNAGAFPTGLKVGVFPARSVRRGTAVPRTRSTRWNARSVRVFGCGLGDQDGQNRSIW